MGLKKSPALLLAICASFVFSAEATNHRIGGKGMGRMGMGDHRSGMTLEDAHKKGLIETGLKPHFPEGYSCPGIASGFASPNRYDGSKRPGFRNAGLHGGMDITLREGTPLLALARGTVSHKGTGGLAMGEYIWLHISPESTGLSEHIYAKYQHLKEPSHLKVGTAVETGQVIAYSGLTGTIGRHFGASGYPHLHLTTIAAPTDQFRVRGPRVISPGQRNVDPVSVYLKPGQFDQVWRNPVSLSGMSVTVQVRRTNERRSTNDKILWPVLCD